MMSVAGVSSSGAEVVGVAASASVRGGAKEEEGGNLGREAAIRGSDSVNLSLVSDPKEKHAETVGELNTHNNSLIIHEEEVRDSSPGNAFKQDVEGNK
jgi:hypothetical protein